MRFGILGPIEVRHGDRLVPLGRRKERAVLAVLLTVPNQIVPLDRLIDLLWGDEPPAQAISSLHAYISNLRRTLEPERLARKPSARLLTRPPGYALAVAPDELDARQFETLVDEAGTACAAGFIDRADRLLTEALDLWRGPTFGEFTDEPFALAEVARLADLRATAIEDRIDVRLSQGRHRMVIGDLEAIVGLVPTRERAWAQLMTALYRSGRQSDALNAFQRAREALAEGAGLEPGYELREIERQILSQDPALDLRQGRTPTVTQPVPVVRQGPSERLVGRFDELHLLDRALGAAAAGRGGVVLVSGEAGVGKSALAAESARRADPLGFRVATTRWPETVDAPVLWPWLQLLRSLPEGAGSTLVAGLEQVVETASAPTPRLLDAILDHVEAQAGAEPLVLIFDDIQWADAPSHLLLQRLLEAVGDLAVLIVLIRRHPAPGVQPVMWETLALLATLPSVTRIDLAGLPVADTAEMIRSATGTAPSAEVAMAVHRQTDGNAFYALELGRLLGSEGSLDDLDRSKRAGIPDSVRDVLRRRLTRLPEQAVAVLNIAAVLGGDIEPRVVQQVSGLDLDTIADQFELATVSGLVREHPSRMGVYRFAHQLVRAAVVDTLPGLRRANLHARAVEAIVAVHGDDDPRHTHELARHAHRAAVVTGPRPAIDRLMRSALQARSMLDLERATNAFGLAASLVVDLPDGPERTGLDAMISMRIAQAHLLLHGYSAIVEAGFSRSLALSRSASSDARVDVLAGFGSHAVLWGAFDEAGEAGRELLDLAGSEDDQAFTTGNYLLAFSVFRGGDGGELRDALAGALGGDDHLVTPSIRLALLALCEVVDGDVEHGCRRAADAVRETLEHDRAGWSTAWTGAFASLALVLAGEAALLLASTEPVAAQGAGLVYTEAALSGCRAWARAATGDLPALAALAKARAALGQLGDVLFRLVLTLAEIELRAADEPVVSRSLLEVAGGEIEARGLVALEPIRRRLQELLAAGEAASVA